MSRISQLYGKPEKVTINDVEFDIHPFTIDELDEIGAFSDKANNADATKKMIRIVLKKGFPDATEEEISKVPADVVLKLAEHVARINNLQPIKAEVDLQARLKPKNVPTE